MAKGSDTPIEVNCLYSDVMKVKDLVPSHVSNVSPDLRNFSLEYPDGQRSLEAVIAKQLQEVVADRNTSTMKGLPGSAFVEVTRAPSTIRQQSAHKYAVPST